MRMSEYVEEPLALEKVAVAAQGFRMLADPTRIQLLWALAHGELSVTDLVERVKKPQPTVSQHLAKLRMARLVTVRREGTQVYYSLENEHVRRLIVDGIHNAEHALPGIPAHHQANQRTSEG